MSHEHSSPVASHSTHLHFKLIKYLDSTKRESCTLAEFDVFEGHSNNQWAHLGVKVTGFHYSSKHKDCVCRCQDKNHGFSKVRSPDVVDMCATYFSNHKDQLLCSKAQWRSHDIAPLSYKEFSSASNDRLPPYDDFESVKPDHVRALSKAGLHQHLRDRPGDSVMPEQVWKMARPGVWSIPNETVETPTTPLGTAYSPQFLPTHLYTGQNDGMSEMSNHAWRETIWSEIQEGAAGHSARISSHPKTPMAELPTDRTSSELDISSNRVHDETLRRLEGRMSEHTLRDLSKYDLARESVAPQNPNSPAQKAAPRLSSYVEEGHDIAHLPSQGDFFSYYTTILPHDSEGTIVEGNYPLCLGPLNNDNDKEHTIQLMTCSHFLHQECLLAGYQIHDPDIGTCPTCGIALCQRDLADRIATDRIVIFGLKESTPLAKAVCITYPYRREIAYLTSEEELAAAQLRLLKDYVDIHAHDVWQQYKSEGIEPGQGDGWFENVVKPASALFKGWNRHSQLCQLFSEHDTFVKYVAWAELVRLINVVRKFDRDSDNDADLPQMKTLHSKLLSAKQEYDEEKKTWGKDGNEQVGCDRLATDVFEAAMQTQLWLDG